MFFEHRAFWLAKDFEHAEEYQDAFAVDEVRGVAAIADGVSSSLFSGSWAKLLVDAAVSDPPEVADPESLGSWLTELRGRWRDPIDADSLAWHQKAKFADGAFSTLMWLEMQPVEAGGQYNYRCYSIGDCCLFHVRDDQVVRGFPFEKSELFDTRPKTICSSAKSAGKLEFDTLDDVCVAGDMLVLCSDAIAVWALQTLESGGSPAWEATWKMSQQRWADNILRLRGQHSIRYDDTTVVMLRLLNPSDLQRPKESAGLIDDVKKNFSGLFSAGKSRRRVE